MMRKEKDLLLKLSFLNFFSSPDDLIRLAAAIDRDEEVHRFWIGEHQGGRQVKDAIAMCHILGAHTKRVRLGAGGVSAIFRPPHLIAASALLTKFSCQNRFDLGVTRGLSASQANFKSILKDTDKARVLKSYHERLATLRELTAPESMPFYILATSKPSAALAGRLGAGLVISYHHGPTQTALKALVEAYRTSFRPGPARFQEHVIAVASGYVSRDRKKLASIRRRLAAALPSSAKPADASTVILDHPAAAGIRLREMMTGVEADELMFLCAFPELGACAETYGNLSRYWSRQNRS
jgi:alkanesulfonate monooxygenase SsuD/methylene tetrahydromethanopterin reductase-like flavin-dependent oxidoreductase (luciferase family)